MQQALPVVPAGLLNVDTPGIDWQPLKYHNRDYITAWIPGNRERDFVEGEGERGQTSYVSAKLGKTKQGTRRTYWCAYGPDDQRNKPQPEEPRYATDGKPRKRRGSFKRGCQARFDVTRYLKQPDRVRIWLQSRSSTDHVDAQGQSCHGPACEDSGRYAAAPVLSSRIRSWVRQCLLIGLSPTTILRLNKERHHHAYMLQHDLHTLRAAETEMAAKEKGSVPRDYLLSKGDIGNAGLLLEKAKWKFSPEQAQSLSAFTEQCPEHILFYKVSSSFPGFALALSSPELLDAAADLGHGSALSIECTSTSVDLKYQLYTALVYDAAGEGLPVAWLACNSAPAENNQQFLSCILSHCRKRRQGFGFSCVLTGSNGPEQLAVIMAMPGVPIFVSDFHISAVLEAALADKVQEEGDRARFKDRLEELLQQLTAPLEAGSSLEGLQPQIAQTLERLYDEGRGQAVFVDWFKREWAPAIEKWWERQSVPSSTLRTAPSLRKYHALLQEAVLSGKEAKQRSRLVHSLAHQILSKVAAHYLSTLHRNRASFSYAWAQEKIARTTVTKAARIATSYVTLPAADGDAAIVTGAAPGEHEIVVHPGQRSAACTCETCLRGHVCEHIVKVATLTKPDLKASHFIRFLGTLNGSAAGGMAALYASLDGSEAGNPTINPKSGRRAARRKADRAAAAAAVAVADPLAVQLPASAATAGPGLMSNHMHGHAVPGTATAAAGLTERQPGAGWQPPATAATAATAAMQGQSQQPSLLTAGMLLPYGPAAAATPRPQPSVMQHLEAIAALHAMPQHAGWVPPPAGQQVPGMCPSSTGEAVGLALSGLDQLRRILPITGSARSHLEAAHKELQSCLCLAGSSRS